MKLVVLLATLSLSCSVALQDGVRSSDYHCSTSVTYIAGDVLLGGGFAFVASRGIGLDPQPAYVVPSVVLAGVFVASAMIGIYKRHHCSNYLEDPAVQARMAEDQRRAAEWLALHPPQQEAQPEQDPNADQNATADPNADPNADSSDASATCPDGVIGGPFNDQCITCPGGAVPSGMYNQQCTCPDGTVWTDQGCAAPTGAPAPSRPMPPARHHKRRGPGAAPAQQTQPQPQQPSQPQQRQQQPRQQTQRAQQAQPQQQPQRQQPAANPIYHALFQQYASEAQNRCQPFQDATSMQSCAAWCTGLLAKRLKCQCVAGPC